MKHNIGNQCGSDNPYKRKTRLLQSLYRLEIGEPEGTGPFRSSSSLFGNMIQNGEISGKNFFTKDIFEYANYRVNHMKEGETIDAFRLFNNLMSSMPMAFNLFHTLKQMLSVDPQTTTLAIRTAFKDLSVAEVSEIGIEYIPSPINLYTGDKTAMDAFIRFKDMQGKDCIIAIETKYSDNLGTNEASKVGIQRELLKSLDLFNDSFTKDLKMEKLRLPKYIVIFC